MSSERTVFCFLGTQLDAGSSEKRWERWRPTVGLVGQDMVAFSRIELLICKAADEELARQVCEDIQQKAPHVEVNVTNLNVTDPWSFAAMYAALHDFSKSYPYEDADQYFVHLTTGTHVAQICLFLLTASRYFPAQLLGSRRKPDGEAWQAHLDVIDLNLANYDQLMERFRRERRDDQSLLKSGIVTRNKAFNELIERIEKVALRSLAPMLLCGPTGAGKSQLASRIYELRVRKHLVKGAFVEVNCATLRGDNAMSALFGHKKGAFTGAASDRAGLLRSADGGILFLDEIGTLGLDEQAMLLRAIEEKRFMPLGSDREVKSDFQLLAGTNSDLKKEVAEGRFRADLFARINLWCFELPGLAHRREDIEPNLDHELELAGREVRSRVTMTAKARAKYLAHALQAPWAGNFRDFKASVMRMAVLADNGDIREAEVDQELKALKAQEPTAGVQALDLVQAVMGNRMADHDLMDLVQVQAAMEAVAQSDSLADAARKLYAATFRAKESKNDSDRLRKFLARYDFDFKTLKDRLVRLQAEHGHKHGRVRSAAAA